MTTKAASRPIAPKSSVFEHEDYRAYLAARLGSRGQRTGLRMKACQAIGCHSTYLSQVLSEKIHLSLEHAESLNSFLLHSCDESDYFLLLVQKSRAGTQSLKNHFIRQLKEIVEQRYALRSRMKITSQIESVDRDRFYSDWVFTAIHALVSIERYHAPAALAAALGVSEQRVSECLEFLETIGLVVKRGSLFYHGPCHLHLGTEDAALISKHHANWRMHAIQSVPRSISGDLHYSAAVSLSQKDAEIMRERLLKAMERNLTTIKLSNEEVGYVYAFDFYRLDR